MDAKSRWWVSEFLGTDCEKAWTHTGWEETMHEWYEWLDKCRRECLTPPQNHKAHDVEGRSTDLGEGGIREIAASLRSKKEKMVKTLAMQTCKTSHGGMRN